MSTWYYYDDRGQKRGPVTGGQLKGLAKTGRITPGTVVETETGKTVVALKVKGLTFITTVQPETPTPEPIQPTEAEQTKIPPSESTQSIETEIVKSSEQNSFTATVPVSGNPFTAAPPVSNSPFIAALPMAESNPFTAPSPMSSSPFSTTPPTAIQSTTLPLRIIVSAVCGTILLGILAAGIVLYSNSKHQNTKRTKRELVNEKESPKKNAERNTSTSLDYLDTMYYFGHNYIDEGRELMFKLAKQGNSNAQLEVARWYYDPSASGGSTSQYVVSSYRKALGLPGGGDIGVRKDWDEAARWCREVLKHNDDNRGKARMLLQEMGKLRSTD